MRLLGAAAWPNSAPAAPPEPPAQARQPADGVALRRPRYPLPGRVRAGIALTLAASATLAIPWTFKQVIDNGFARSADPSKIAPYFQGLIGVVVVLALATAMRFYFVSWLGERIVADIRTAVQRNLLRLAPRFFEENRPSEIASRLTSDTAQIETGRSARPSRSRCATW